MSNYLAIGPADGAPFVPVGPYGEALVPPFEGAPSLRSSARTSRVTLVRKRAYTPSSTQSTSQVQSVAVVAASRPIEVEAVQSTVAISSPPIEAGGGSVSPQDLQSTATISPTGELLGVRPLVVGSVKSRPANNTITLPRSVTASANSIRSETATSQITLTGSGAIEVDDSQVLSQVSQVNLTLGGGSIQVLLIRSSVELSHPRIRTNRVPPTNIISNVLLRVEPLFRYDLFKAGRN